MAVGGPGSSGVGRLADMVNMNVSAASASAMSRAQLGQEVAIRTMKKSQDVAKQQGQAMVDMLQQAGRVQKQAFAADPHKGTQLDVVG